MSCSSSRTSGNFLVVAAAATILVSCAAAAATGATIPLQFPNARFYSEWRVPREGFRAAVTPWAVFDGSVRVDGVRSNASDFDDNSIFQPIDFCIPFFAQDSAMMHISANGFLSPMPVAMCTHFCSASTEIEGFYKFGSRVAEYDGRGGGDWPAVALYLHDLNPAAWWARNRGIFVQKKNKTYGGETISTAIVEFYGTPQFQPDSEQLIETSLTAQVELWANGTIIFRYQEVLRVIRSYLNLPPSVGLVWSHLQRHESVLPQFVNPEVSPSADSDANDVRSNVVAIRFDPHLDTCMNVTDCDACARVPGCDWCSNVQRCYAHLISADFCHGADRHTSNATCDILAVTENQRFYATEVSSAEPFVDIGAHPDARSLVGDGEVIGDAYVNVTLHFAFPYFYNPPVRDPNNARMRRQIFVSPQQFISVVSPRQNCPATEGFCFSGGYDFVISPFTTTSRPIQLTREHTLRLPARTAGDFMCSRPACPPAYVIQVIDQSTRSLNGQLLSFQVILDADGVVEFYYKKAFNESLMNAQPQVLRELRRPPPGLTATPNHCTEASQASPFLTFPRALIGLIRNGANDPASVVIPPTTAAAAPGVRIRFTPVPGCPDCNGRGICNPRTRACECEVNFAGPACEQCNAGFYGPTCRNCSFCLNKGVCDDGVDGTGACRCVEPYSGRFCERECPMIPGETRSITCPNCNLVGGYCDCGRCVCDETKGWRGVDCELWEDPCRRLSLDGCATCVAYEGLPCVYCATFNCVASINAVGIPRENATVCGNFFSAATADRCPAFQRPFSEDGSLTIIAIVVLFTAMGACTFITVMVVCVCRRRPPNPMVAGAVAGTPEFEMPRREREVIQLQILPRPTNGEAVQGIPLHQIPLKELHAIQQQLRRDGALSSACHRDGRREGDGPRVFTRVPDAGSGSNVGARRLHRHGGEGEGDTGSDDVELREAPVAHAAGVQRSEDSAPPPPPLPQLRPPTVAEGASDGASVLGA